MRAYILHVQVGPTTGSSTQIFILNPIIAIPNVVALDTLPSSTLEPHAIEVFGAQYARDYEGMLATIRGLLGLLGLLRMPRLLWGGSLGTLDQGWESITRPTPSSASRPTLLPGKAGHCGRLMATVGAPIVSNVMFPYNFITKPQQEIP